MERCTGESGKGHDFSRGYFRYTDNLSACCMTCFERHVKNNREWARKFVSSPHESGGITAYMKAFPIDD